MAPEPEDDEFDYFPECCFFWSGFCSNWPSSFQNLYWDGYMLSNQKMIHEKNRCSQPDLTKNKELLIHRRGIAVTVYGWLV